MNKIKLEIDPCEGELLLVSYSSLSFKIFCRGSLSKFSVCLSEELTEGNDS